MKIVGIYSFNKGKKYIKKHYPKLLKEIHRIIELVDASSCKVKISKEKTMKGKSLYSPIKLNQEFKKLFKAKQWKNIDCSSTYILFSLPKQKCHK